MESKRKGKGGEERQKGKRKKGKGYVNAEEAALDVFAALSVEVDAARDTALA